MHYAEGSLMNWLVMKLVFSAIPQRPMPFFVKPIARSLCDKVQSTLIDPNLQNSLNFIEANLAQHTWSASKRCWRARVPAASIRTSIRTTGECARDRPINVRKPEVARR